MKYIYVTELPDPKDVIIYRVSDKTFDTHLTAIKKIVGKHVKDNYDDLHDENFVWNLDSKITKYLDSKKASYNKLDTVPFRTQKELDELCDEYWIFAGQVDEEGEQ